MTVSEMSERIHEKNKGLLPCPFCGGQVSSWVFCADCGVRYQGSQARKYFNTCTESRSGSPSVDVKALAKRITFYGFGSVAPTRREDFTALIASLITEELEGANGQGR